MVDNINPAYPNGRCASCGFGLNINKACNNNDCAYVIELRKLIREVYLNHRLIERNEALAEDSKKTIAVLREQNRKFKQEMQEILNINKEQ